MLTRTPAHGRDIVRMEKGPALRRARSNAVVVRILIVLIGSIVIFKLIRQPILI